AAHRPRRRPGHAQGRPGRFRAPAQGAGPLARARPARRPRPARRRSRSARGHGAAHQHPRRAPEPTPLRRARGEAARMTVLRARAPGKVNLALYLGPTRKEDGKHELVSLDAPATLHTSTTITTA